MHPSPMEAATVTTGSALSRLLEQLRPQRTRRLSSREVRMEVASAALMALAVAGLALAFGGAHRSPHAVDVALLVAYAAACSQVRLYIGGGYAPPTLLALVPMLYLLPPAAVPVAMAAGLMAAAAVDVLRGCAHPDRLLPAIGDAWFAVGAALVFGLAGSPTPAPEHWVFMVPALLSHVVFDTASAVLREWIGRGIPPMVQLRVLAVVYGVDVLLTPIAVVAVAVPFLGHRGWLLTASVTAVLAGVAVDRRHRIEEEAARTDELRRERIRLQSVLRRLGAALAAGLDGPAMLAAVRETAQEALEASLAFAGAPSRVSGPAVSGEALLARTADQAAVGGAMATGVAGEWHALACGLGRDGTDVLAVARRGDRFTADEVEVLHHLAAHAAVSLENARLHARVHEQATTDELTGLANHRALQAVLAEHLSGERFRPRVGFILIDIDDFKHVNDTWGHLHGDHVLREVAQALRSRCRSGDCLARYGGEELAVVAPRTDVAGALALAEDLRSAVAQLDVRGPQGQPLHVTVSVGVATSPADGTTPRELVAAADEALYQAKRDGKDRVVAAAVPARVG